METIYADLIGEAAQLDLLERLAVSRARIDEGASSSDAATPFERLLAELEEQSGLIDDQARQIILETAFRVACADETIEAGEQDKLRRIAAALGISEGVIELAIDTFQQRRRTAGSAAEQARTTVMRHDSA